MDLGGSILVGRDAQLTELRRALSHALTARGGLVLLCGEPGIGKTALADALADRALHVHARVTWGRCWEAGGAPAYFPWLSVLDHVSATLDAAQLAALPSESLGMLSTLSPTLAARVPCAAPPRHSDPEQARFQLHQAVMSLLHAAAAPQGLLLVLDDLHAADVATLDLLWFVARQLRGSRVLIVGTFRDVEARRSPDVSEPLARIAREAVTTLHLSPLSQPASADLLRARAEAIDDTARCDVLRRAQGNPLFVIELARLFAQGASVVSALPDNVRAVVRQRLALVAPEHGRLLDLLAVLGDEAEVALAAQVAGIDRSACEVALRALCGAGVLKLPTLDRARFSHALLREERMSALSEHDRTTWHDAIAHALAQRPSDPQTDADLAHHRLHGTCDDLDGLVSLLTRVAQRALSVFAYAQAIAWLQHAEQIAERLAPEAHAHARLLIALGNAHMARGDVQRGHDCCRRAARIGRQIGDAELLALAALGFGREITAALIDSELIALLDEALAALPETDTSLRVHVTARLAAALQPHRDMQYPIALAQTAIASARRLNDPPTLLTALYTGMSAMMDVADPAVRLPLNLETEQLALTQGDHERLLRTHARLVFDCVELGDLPAADARIERLAELADQLRARRMQWRVQLFRGLRAMIGGRFEEAEAYAAQAERWAIEVDDPQRERCLGFHREGLLRAAERHAQMRAFDLQARQLRMGLYSAPHWQNGGSAFTYARLEDEDGARRCLALVPQDDWPLAQNPPAFFHLGEPLAYVGSAAQCRTLYAQLLSARGRFVSWGWTGFVWDGPASRVLALLSARLGQHVEAHAHFEAAIAQLTALDAGPYLARTQYEYARCLLAGDQPTTHDNARRLLDVAQSRAEALGMSGLCTLIARRRDQAPSVRVAVSPSSFASVPVASTPCAMELALQFAREGDTWIVRYADQDLRLRDSLGLQYLATLCAQPGRSVLSLELAAGHAADAAQDDHAVIDAGDAGELLDARARASYRARLLALQEALAEAEARGDGTAAERAQEEIDALHDELSRAVGKSGRVRRGGVAAERARSAVQRRIRSAIDRISEQAPALGALLRRSIRTGLYCTFHPERST